jgi:hypothetical protein
MAIVWLIRREVASAATTHWGVWGVWWLAILVTSKGKDTMVTKAYVKVIFAQAPDRHATVRTNPITGGSWVPGLDSTEAQIRVARRALMARDACAADGRLGNYSLPLSYDEREAGKSEFGLEYAISLFARSIAGKDFILTSHPPFDIYMSGLLARPGIGPRLLAADPSLAVRYPPTPLIGLDSSGYFRCARMRRAMGCLNVPRRP